MRTISKDEVFRLAGGSPLWSPNRAHRTGPFDFNELDGVGLHVKRADVDAMSLPRDQPAFGIFLGPHEIFNQICLVVYVLEMQPDPTECLPMCGECFCTLDELKLRWRLD